MSTMQKVLLGGALVVFLLCSAGGLWGYYRLLPRWREGSSEAIESEIAYQVQRSMENALVLHNRIPCSVQLEGHDLDVSSYTDTSGERGVEIFNGDAAILNGEVIVSESGLDIYVGDLRVHAVPVVRDGVFSLEESELDQSLSWLLFDGDAVEAGFERGLNAGLQSAQIVPASVDVADGVMTIGCETDTVI